MARMEAGHQLWGVFASYGSNLHKAFCVQRPNLPSSLTVKQHNSVLVQHLGFVWASEHLLMRTERQS